jgi:hypothetical protein
MSIHIYLDYGPFTERLHPRNPGGMFVSSGQSRGKSGGGGRGKASLKEIHRMYAREVDPERKRRLRQILKRMGATVE